MTNEELKTLKALIEKAQALSVLMADAQSYCGEIVKPESVTFTPPVAYRYKESESESWSYAESLRYISHFEFLEPLYLD